jgi:hypothetical protein
VPLLAAYPKQLYMTCNATCWTVSLTCDLKVKLRILAIAAGVVAYSTTGPQPIQSENFVQNVPAVQIVRIVQSDEFMVIF